MSKCPPVYRNLGLLSFGEGRYVTADILRQCCKNDEYLKQTLEKVEYLTPPAIRKRFSPVLVDTDNSFGFLAGNSKNVTFDNSDESITFVDFTEPGFEKYVDAEKTTAVIHSAVDNNGNHIQQLQTPTKTVSTINRETKDESPWPGTSGLHCNEHWYIAFDRNRQYRLQPNWLFGDEAVGYGIYNTEIPAVGRAQSFKPKVSGYLEGITVNLKCDIDKNNTASPLIVQLRPTVTKNGVAYPDNFQYTMLAEERVRFSNSTPDICTISFTHPPYVEKGKSYAMVFLSPLSHPYNCYHLGGWSKNCGADPYPDGDAFYTWNNGADWTRYGKGEDVSYSNGRFAPVDFAFELQIREDTEEYIQNDWHYVYLNPIRTSPVAGVKIDGHDNAAEPGIDIIYEVSNNGRKWYSLNKNNRLNFTNHESMTFVRAKMRTNHNSPAIINWIEVTLYYDAPTEMYVRTHYYYPRTEPMLGANVWGRVYAPFETEPTVSCSAELISEKIAIEHFKVIDVDDLKDYTWIEEVDENKINNKSGERIAEYLEDNPSVIEALKKENIYILPFLDKNNDFHHFFTEFEFTNSPAYPILSCSLQPEEQGISTVNYGEWYDFVYNYGNTPLYKTIPDPNQNDEEFDYTIHPDCMLFYTDVLETMVKGTFTITYNPLIITDLTESEVGKHTSDNEEGLILDYFKETFVVDESLLESRIINLRTAPVDPIRKVILNPDDDNTQLYEDEDFTVDYDNNSLIFEPLNDDGTGSILQINDVVEIVYTPNIDDAGISIGYYATRENTRKQCYLKPNYLEYKT